MCITQQYLQHKSAIKHSPVFPRTANQDENEGHIELALSAVSIF